MEPGGGSELDELRSILEFWNWEIGKLMNLEKHRAFKVTNCDLEKT